MSLTKLSLARNIFSRPVRVWLSIVTSWLETGKSLTFFYSAMPHSPQENNLLLECDSNRQKCRGFLKQGTLKTQRVLVCLLSEMFFGVTILSKCLRGLKRPHTRTVVNIQQPRTKMSGDWIASFLENLLMSP
jgi:hypothetical protein